MLMMLTMLMVLRMVSRTTMTILRMMLMTIAMTKHLMVVMTMSLMIWMAVMMTIRMMTTATLTMMMMVTTPMSTAMIVLLLIVVKSKIVRYSQRESKQDMFKSVVQRKQAAFQVEVQPFAVRPLLLSADIVFGGNRKELATKSF